MNTDPDFVEKVKSTNEISEAKITGQAEQTANNQGGGENGGYVGVHLFVMVHGFQGNHNDMRLFKNQISLQHPDAVVLLS